MIKIVSGKMGWILQVNGHYMSHNLKAIKKEHGIPYGCTEWVSIKSLKEFWNEYRILIIDATKKPYKSVNGKLELLQNN